MPTYTLKYKLCVRNGRWISKTEKFTTKWDMINRRYKLSTDRLITDLELIFPPCIEMLGKLRRTRDEN